MSTYIGYCIRLPLLKPTMRLTMAFKDLSNLEHSRNGNYLYNTFNEFNKFFKLPEDQLAMSLSHITSRMSCGSAYFSWDYAGYEDNVLLTKSSSWLLELEPVVDFLNAIKPALDLKEGLVLVRVVYEESNQETIVYVKDGDFVIGDGYKYKTNEHNELDDGNHPSDLQVGSDWNPPFDYEELMALNKANNY